jgi:hypothetical protein
MSSFIIRRPSPAMVVAFIALLVALGGSAYALGVGEVKTRNIARGAVTTPKLKRGAVTAAKLRAGAVRTGKIASNAVTGTTVNESTLGQVPSATTANSANTANQANSANTANTANFAGNAGLLQGNPSSAFVPASKVVTSGSLVKADHGQTKTLLKSGPFTYQLECADAGGGNTNFKIIVESTEAGSRTIFDDVFGPGTPATLFDLTDTGPTYVILDFAGAAAPSGAASQGIMTFGVNVFGADCATSMHLIG